VRAFVQVANGEKFTILGIICIVVGGASILIFLIFCDEPYGDKRSNASTSIQGGDDASLNDIDAAAQDVAQKNVIMSAAFADDKLRSPGARKQMRVSEARCPSAAESFEINIWFCCRMLK
jgi:hypothetical protein